MGRWFFVALVMIGCSAPTQPMVVIPMPGVEPRVMPTQTAPTLPPPPPTSHRSSSSADRDGDGIADNRDKCPDDPEDLDGFQDDDGCPDPDNDLDGIPDVRDKCPNQPETFNGYQDDDGCPDHRP